MTSALPPAVENSAQDVAAKDSAAQNIAAQNIAAQNIMDLERDYLLQTYARYPLALSRGKGCYLYDLEGRRYLDFLTGIGVNALGHAHPRRLRVVARAGQPRVLPRGPGGL